jgi:hypothetical protein
LVSLKTLFRYILSILSGLDAFFDLKRKYEKRNIYLEYLTSIDYYKEYQFIAKRSKLVKEKLQKKDKNNGFVRL